MCVIFFFWISLFSLFIFSLYSFTLFHLLFILSFFPKDDFVSYVYCHSINLHYLFCYKFLVIWFNVSLCFFFLYQIFSMLWFEGFYIPWASSSSFLYIFNSTSFCVFISSNSKNCIFIFNLHFRSLCLNSCVNGMEVWCFGCMVVFVLFVWVFYMLIKNFLILEVENQPAIYATNNLSTIEIHFNNL